MKKRQIIKLSGEWEFGYTPDIRPVTELEQITPETFETQMPIPGYWDDHKDRMGICNFYGRDAVFNPEYRPMEFPMGQILPDASKPFLVGVGWYRKNVFIPKNYDDNSFILQIGPCIMNAAVWCNGKKVITHIGYSTGFEAELTDFIIPGKENEIILAISNAANDRRGCAIRGYKGRRGGIGDGIRLKIAGKSFIKDFHVYTKDNNLVWNVNLNGKLSNSLTLVLCINCNKSQRVIMSDTFEVKNKNISFTTSAQELQSWSDNKPQLCQIKLFLKRGSEILDSTTRNWGKRELAVKGYQIFLNESPVYLRGCTEHCYFPESCNPHWDKTLYKQNIKKLKQVGFNWLRFHTWCPPTPYLEAADEEGMLIQVEFPRFSTINEWEDIIRTARQHPSVILFCGGNEDHLCEERIEELKHLGAICNSMAPGCLFNPQEGLRGVEYGEENTMGKTIDIPFRHNPQRLAALAEFSDVYGTYNNGLLSYFTGDFDKPEDLDKQLSVYKKPCLSHEIGIIGNYLNIDLEKRYENTAIGSELFSCIRKYLEQSGLLHKAAVYYYNSCMLTEVIRKHTIENARRCSLLCGYDLLGGIDTHWHRCGYPCGILNEFYELKPGQSASKISAYNGESVLLLDIDCKRNLVSGEKFSHKVNISYWGQEVLNKAKLIWQCKLSDNTVILSGMVESLQPLVPGKLTDIHTISFTVPTLAKSEEVRLTCNLFTENASWGNEWSFWIFPPSNIKNNFHEVKVSAEITHELLDFITTGGSVLLVDNFPLSTTPLTFQPATAGRVNGDLATVIYDHPALDGFPHQGFCDWQFYSLLQNSRSMCFDMDKIPFAPIIEIVSSFKHIRKKAALCEFKVGSGRIMMTSLNFAQNDAASTTLFEKLMEYLSAPENAECPELNIEALQKLLSITHSKEAKLATDYALDPNR